MINTILAFAILWIAMYVCIKIINFIFAVFNLVSRQDVELSKTENESWWKRTVEAVFEYLQWADFPTNSINAVHSPNSGEIELEPICTEAGASIEGIEEGVSAIAESVGEHIATAINSLSNN